MTKQTSEFSFWRRRSVLCIGLPTLLVFIYFAVLAKPAYESQAMIIVQNSNKELMMPIPVLSSGIIGGAGNASIKDAYVLLEYMKSPELIQKLDASYNIREHYASPAFDIIRKLKNDANFDDLVGYFRSQLHLKVSSDSGIISLSVKAFDAELAQLLLTAMIQQSELTINDLNERILLSTTDIAERELQKTKDDLKTIRERMFEFQVNRKVISPDAEIQMLLANLSELDARILSKKTELKTKEQFLKEDAFDLKTIRQEISGLEAQRNEEAVKLFLEDGTSIPNSAHEYESLKLESEFALQSYTAALAAFEKAKLEALRQEKFLLTISAPTQPVDASYPKPWQGTLTAFIIISLVYGIARLVIATILDHTV